MSAPLMPSLWRRVLFGPVLYLLVASILLFLRLVPVFPGSTTAWPGPDLLLLFTLVWVMRRPEQVPAPVIALAGMVEDLVLLRPPGLWAAILLVGAETLRRRDEHWREQVFMLEWLRMAFLIMMMMLANRVIMVVFLLPVPPLGMVVMQLVATIAAYPLIVLFGRVILGLRRMGSATQERFGYR